MFSTGGEELPVAFPFDAFYDLMGDKSYLAYLNGYQAPKHQLQILEVGLKYGHQLSGKVYRMNPTLIRKMVNKDMRFLAQVFRFYDGELQVFFDYYRQSEDQDEEGASKADEQEKK